MKCGPTYTIATTTHNIVYFWGGYYKNTSENGSTLLNEYIMVKIKKYILFMFIYILFQTDLNPETDQPVSRKLEIIFKPKSLLA